MTQAETNRRVSIITPSLNKVAFVRRTVESVLSQDYRNIEHIVIDGGSTDGTLEILRGYKHLKLVSEPDDGQTQAINKGLRMATGSIFTWLNADDFLFPDAVSRAVGAFQDFPKAHFVYGDFEVLDGQGRMIKLVKVIDYDRNILIYGRNLINQPASFFRKEVIDSLGMLDEGLVFCMDYDLWVRAALEGMNFLNIRQPLAGIHLYSGSKMMDFTDKLLIETRQILNNNGLLWFENNDILNKAAFFSLYYAYKFKCFFKRLMQRKELRFVMAMQMARRKMNESTGSRAR